MSKKSWLLQPILRSNADCGDRPGSARSSHSVSIKSRSTFKVAANIKAAESDPSTFAVIGRFSRNALLKQDDSFGVEDNR